MNAPKPQSIATPFVVQGRLAPALLLGARGVIGLLIGVSFIAAIIGEWATMDALAKLIMGLVALIALLSGVLVFHPLLLSIPVRYKFGREAIVYQTVLRSQSFQVSELRALRLYPLRRGYRGIEYGVHQIVLEFTDGRVLRLDAELISTPMAQGHFGRDLSCLASHLEVLYSLPLSVDALTSE